MRKIFSLIKKDLVLQFRNIGVLVAFVIIPFASMGMIGYFTFTMSKDLSVIAEDSLRPDFGGLNKIVSRYQDKDIEFLVDYKSSAEIEEIIKNDKFAVVYYIKDNRKVIYINRNNQKAGIILNTLKAYFNNPNRFDFAEEYTESSNYDLITMIINMLVLMGSVALAYSSLAQEIENQNILILKKCGFSIPDIFIGKNLYITIFEMIIFTTFYFIITGIGLIPDNPALFLIMPLLIILSAQVGILISSITIKRELQSLMLVIFYLPSVFYLQIEGSLNPVLKFILNFNPLVMATVLLKQALINNIEFITLIFSIFSFIICFALSNGFIKKNILKNI